MRGYVYDRYGSVDVLRVAEEETPRPGRGEVLVRVAAAALNPKDALVRKGRFRRLSGSGFPKRVGLDLAGVVEAIGPGVSGLSVGQRVWGHLDEWKSLRGTLATHVVPRAAEIAAMPAALSFEEAAAVPLAAQTALQALRDRARLTSGCRVLVLGGSGGVGTFAIQIARALGAVVTSVSSDRNLELCRSLGADETLDYGVVDALSGAVRYEVVFDAYGSRSASAARAALEPGGTYVTTVPSLRILVDTLLGAFRPPRARLVVVRSRTRDLDFLGGLVAERRLRPVIDRIVSFDEVPEAFRYLETRRARGKIVVRIGT